MFVGRNHELKQLEQAYHATTSKLVAIYGRRRIGKSFLVEHFTKNKRLLVFEGLENETTPLQITQFTHDLALQLKDKVLLHVHFNTWEMVFDYLTDFFSKQNHKWVLFLDEFQWLAANQGRLVSLIKKYWDQHWKKQNILLILCGSVSSYMVKNVIKSKALYGRINLEICLGQLYPSEAMKLLRSKRCKEEIFKYLLIIGSVPKYIDALDPNHSLEKNINTLCFTQNGDLVEEYEKIFYSQFKEYKTYEQIIRLLQEGPLDLLSISKALKIPSGGGLLSYLTNLEKALFITCYTSYEKNLNSKNKKYKLTDEYLRFYFKYMQKNLKAIKVNATKNLFNLLVKDQWEPWLGHAFENFCLKNAEYLATKMGFNDQVISFGPYFKKESSGFQIDLIYVRADKTITLCEIKYHDRPITTKIIREVEKKCDLLSPFLPRGHTLEKALISQYGPDKHLNDANYFHHFLSIKELF
ncbi:MAG: ATP-binding protein [Oligoflexia bacterium]|nr:ATP-binding protein [Oligoflexia bacterium]MBF0366042.1 ATP-binding protein [Oligoflexia bacterium]